MNVTTPKHVRFTTSVLYNGPKAAFCEVALPQHILSTGVSVTHESKDACRIPITFFSGTKWKYRYSSLRAQILGKDLGQ